MNNGARIYLDTRGTGLEPLIERPMPTLWLRAPKRLPSLADAETLKDIVRPTGNLLCWRVSQVSSDATGRALKRFPRLIQQRIAETQVFAQTGINNDDQPSYLDIADGSQWDSAECDAFVADSLFGKLSGLILGDASNASNYIYPLTSFLREWKTKTRKDADLDVCAFIDGLLRLSSNPVISVVDSNMWNYWTVPVDDIGSIESRIAASTLATEEEFLRWQRIGWDLKVLQRGMLGQ